MSFTLKVKSELCGIPVPSKCCRLSEIYGMLFFCGKFTKNLIELKTESLDTALFFEERIYSLFKIKLKADISESFGNAMIYRLKIESPKECRKIIKELGYSDSEPENTLKKPVFDRNCCIPSFIKGAFLVIGTLSDPKKEYRLEFNCDTLKQSRYLSTVLSESGFESKYTNRKGVHVVYFKDSLQIEDILTMLKATNISLEIMNEKVYKNIRNNANRITNCETANITKTIDAAASQLKAIETIQNTIGLDALEPGLKEVAVMRYENIELPLSELGRLLTPPLSRSGVNHRLNKLKKIAHEIHAKGSSI